MYVFHNRHYVCVISVGYFLQPEVPEYLLQQPRAAWAVQADEVEVQMATVSLRFNNSEGFAQQSMTYCVLCVGEPNLGVDEPLATDPHLQWKLDCVAGSIKDLACSFVVGWFGKDPSIVEHIGYKCGAVLDCPLAAVFVRDGEPSGTASSSASPTSAVAGTEYYTMPVFLLVIGSFNTCAFDIADRPTLSILKERTSCPDIASPFDLIENNGDMVLWCREGETKRGKFARWPERLVGSAVATSLNTVKVKAVDFDKWIPHTFQNVVWMGNQTRGAGATQRRWWHLQRRPQRRRTRIGNHG